MSISGFGGGERFDGLGQFELVLPDGICSLLFCEVLKSGYKSKT